MDWNPQWWLAEEPHGGGMPNIIIGWHSAAEVVRTLFVPTWKTWKYMNLVLYALKTFEFCSFTTKSMESAWMLIDLKHYCTFLFNHDLQQMFGPGYGSKFVEVNEKQEDVFGVF